jgi:DNA-3-methyladenine glycosylase II
MTLQAEYWQKACRELSKKDKVLAELIRKNKHAVLSTKRKPFLTLVKAILGQQVSVASADAIFARLLEKLPRKNLSYKNILALEESEIKACGISRQKTQYLLNIARHFEKNKITNAYFDKKSPEAIREELIAIKGIGNWTMEMFELFYLNLPDIFPLGDIGLVRALEHFYKLDAKEEMEKYSKRWQPYRTVATWYLWCWTDPDVVEY